MKSSIIKFRLLSVIVITIVLFSCNMSLAEEQFGPCAPDRLTATAVSATRINLSWADNSENETGFKIEQSLDGTSFTQIDTVYVGVVFCFDAGLSADTQYWYRIRAYNAAGDSEYSNIVSSTTDTVSSLIIADHSFGTLSSLISIPVSAIEYAKQTLHIAYGRMSHGGQLVYGMNGLVPFMNNLGYTQDLFAWNNGGTGGALDLHDHAMPDDVGYYPQWVEDTRAYLDDVANSDVNVVIWSWCGEVSDRTEQSMIDTYLVPMTQLEIDYPDITFVYMTGHVDGTGLTGNLHLRNQQIRDYCTANNKVLYDFEDIESYDPDGEYYGDKFVTDACNYDFNNSDSTSEDENGLPIDGDSNWAIDWQIKHEENKDWYNCESAHSQPLNANQKAYAAWWLWARIAGWDGN